jgi:hypothetical protein
MAQMRTDEAAAPRYQYRLSTLVHASSPAIGIIRAVTGCNLKAAR